MTPLWFAMTCQVSRKSWKAGSTTKMSVNTCKVGISQLRKATQLSIEIPGRRIGQRVLDFLHFSVHTPQHIHTCIWHIAPAQFYILGPFANGPDQDLFQLQQAWAQLAIFQLVTSAMLSTSGTGWRQLGHPHPLALQLPVQHDVHGLMSMWPAGVQSLRSASRHGLATYILEKKNTGSPKTQV